MTEIKKAGRPTKESTKVIAIPLNRVKAVEHALNRTIVTNQVPIVKIRVPVTDIERIREVIKNDS